MLVPNQYLTIRWHPRNKEWYINKGYVFTKIGDEFTVKADDLTLYSHDKVLVQCDYCGAIIEKAFKEYIRGKKSGKDCCKNCQKFKCVDVCLEKYGVSNVFAREDVKEQIKETNKLLYGHENIAHGSLRCKVIETNMERYGVPYTTQAPEIIVKMRQSLYENGNVPSSKKEKEICQMLEDIYGLESCFPNYAYDRLNFDCLLIINNIKIDVEYDGWYWHKDKQEEDKRRNYFLTRRGFKVLRIRSSEEMPTKEQIIEAVNILLSTDKKLMYIDLDIR